MNSRLAISDANIFIDLLELDLPALLFGIGFEVATTQEVFDELLPQQQAVLQGFVESGELRVHVFSPAEFAQLTAFRLSNRLSFSDHSILFLAQKHAALVLTGDGPMRRACQQLQLETHGILWLFDQFLATGLLEKPMARILLTRLMQLNQWLPRELCLAKLEEWASN